MKSQDFKPEHDLPLKEGILLERDGTPVEMEPPEVRVFRSTSLRSWVTWLFGGFVLMVALAAGFTIFGILLVIFLVLGLLKRLFTTR